MEDRANREKREQLYESKAKKAGLVDFKPECGLRAAGDPVTADEIPPGACRPWDIGTPRETR